MLNEMDYLNVENSQSKEAFRWTANLMLRNFWKPLGQYWFKDLDDVVKLKATTASQIAKSIIKMKDLGLRAEYLVTAAVLIA